MNKGEDVKFVLSVSIVFVLVTSIFKLIGNLNSTIGIKDGIVINLGFFVNRNTLWIVVVVAIVLIIGMYLKRFGVVKYFDILKDSKIRLTAGLLIVLQGIVNLSAFLPIAIASIKSSIETAKLIEGTEKIFLNSLISNSITIAAILLQILVGVYLLKFYKEDIKSDM